MFNRCWRWRVLLARRADGNLSPAQWGTLQNHLRGCDSCRAAADADDALHNALGFHSALMDTDRAKRFDDGVVSTLATPVPFSGSMFPLLWARYRRGVLARWRSLPIDFLAQIGGGAAVAVSLTSFFLIPALHSQSPQQTRAALLSEKVARDATQRAVLPVPMETLLNTHSPRAAMLWTVPGSRKERRSPRTPSAASPAAPSRTGPPPKVQSDSFRLNKRAALDFRQVVG